MIAYDTNILIYALEGASPWAAAAQEVMTHGERDGAVLSVLAWQEIMTGAVLRGGGLDGQVAVALGNLGATKFAPVTLAICKRAATLTKTYGRQLYGYDAIHIATALEYKAEAFVTNDKILIDLNVGEITIRGL